MIIQKPFIDAIRLLMKRFTPLLVSPAVAPFIIVLMGLLLHGSFAVSPTTRIIYGGPGEEASEVIPTAHAAELVAISQIEGVIDELEGESGPIMDLADSVSAGQVGLFGAAEYITGYGVEVHRVKPGETFFSIAQLYGVEKKALSAANWRLSEPLIVGDELVIPDVPVAPVLTTDNRRLAGAYLPAGFRWPAPGKIGPPHGRYDGRDIPNLLGTPLTASGAGTIIAADYGWDGGYGNRIIIDHGEGLYTLYGHLNDLVVSVGQTVKQGEVIGFMGSTGRSTGPHVHFEVRWGQ